MARTSENVTMWVHEGATYCAHLTPGCLRAIEMSVTVPGQHKAKKKRTKFFMRIRDHSGRNVRTSPNLDRLIWEYKKSMRWVQFVDLTTCLMSS